MSTIEEFGSINLVQNGSNYFFVDPIGGSSVELSFAGTPVVAGQFGGWVPIGVERTADGYQLAWRMTGTDTYTVWNTDSSGNYVSSSLDPVSGSAALQPFETSFSQDFNGDGFIGAPVVTPVAIEESGSTNLVETGSNYFFVDPIGGSSVELSYAGTPVVAGQFGAWVPIGVEQTASGYQLAWKMTGADTYTVWNTDGSGNFVSSALDPVSGSAALQSFEASFHQDFNGDGVIGAPLPTPVVIEEFGSTNLVETGSNYFFVDPSSSSSVELSYAGTPVVAGQFDEWVPIGVEQTAGGYQLAWKMTGADTYTVWNTNGSGNFVSSALDPVSGSAALQSFEAGFHQDFNGDGVIGAPLLIEEFGSTSLVENGARYFFAEPTGVSVELSYAGAPVVAGQFGGWVPIGVEQIASGYQLAWKMTGADTYTVWNTDSGGDYVSSPLNPVPGGAALQSFEASFHQDLNGDGVIGVSPSTPVVIEDFGSIKLVENGSNYFFVDPAGGSAELSYAGTPVVAGQFGQWVPIGVEQIAGGYQLAWKMTGADTYTVWNTDSSGNYVSSPLDPVSGSAALQSFEVSFHQDFNGDGVIDGGSAGAPHFVYEGIDGDGAQVYGVTWDSQGLQPFAVRVLAPDHPSNTYDHTFLYVLPVEAGLAQSTWGSGLDELQKLDVQNQYNATLIEPIFQLDPWYADSSADATINYETFMSTLLPAWVDSQFDTSGTDENLLIGFSKSGYGALDLLLKHPSVFAEAAAWDFPAGMSYGDFGSSLNYGSEANFQDNYQLSDTFIDAWKAPFTSEDRIWIAGSDIFQDQVSEFDALLTSNGVMHTLGPATHDEHSWSGGWLSDAVAGLYQLDGSNGASSSALPTAPLLDGSAGGQTLTAGSSPTTLIGGPNDILNGGADADTFVFKPDFGVNTVNNFTPGVDSLQFDLSFFASPEAVLGEAEQIGSDVVITHDPLNQVTLHNVQLASLHTSDFNIV